MFASTFFKQKPIGNRAILKMVVEQASKKPEHTLPADQADGNLEDSSIILEFIALRVKAHGKGPFVL